MIEANGGDVFFNAGKVANAGTLAATAGGVLLVNGIVEIENAPSGVIEAVGAASHVDIGGTIVGGTLKTANGGSIRGITGGTLDGSKPGAAITNAGMLTVPDVSSFNDLTLLGTVNNKGSIALQANTHQISLLIGTGGAALQGGGKVTLTDSDFNIIEGTASANTLLNVDNTISGAGKLGNGQMTLINAAKGVINATGATNGLVIDTGSNVIRNFGTLRASGAGGMTIVSDIINSGTIKAAGGGTPLQIEGALTNDGKLLAASGELFIGGPIGGAGSATINFGGTLEFDASLTGITQNVSFANIGTGKATLMFDAPATTDPNLIYNGVISGFSSAKDRIDLTGLSFSGNASVTKTLQGGNTVIEVTESGKVVDLTLAGNRMASHFVVSDDGSGGTLIVDPPAAANPAMAGFSPATPIIHWKHGVSGDFAIAANWNPASVPGASDAAALDATGTYTVASNADETISSLTTIATATLAINGDVIFEVTNGTGAGANAGTIAVGDRAELILGGIVKNTGKIKANATGNTASLVFGDGSGATLKGGGKVLLSDSAGNFVGSNIGGTFINVDNTIAGAGQIGGAFAMTLDNEAKGVINATGKLNALMIVTGSPVTNLGVLEATGPAGLVIMDTVDNWPSGIVQAVGPGALVSLQGATLVGGTLKTVNGGIIRIDGSNSTSTLDGSTPAAPVTNSASITVTDKNTLKLVGTINNTGSIALNATPGNRAVLLIGTGGAALRGGGKVAALSSNFGNIITGQSASDTLTNIDNVIASGKRLLALGDGQLTLVNQAKGVIEANGGDVFLDTGAGKVSNAGTLAATAGGTFFVQGLVENAASGVIEAVGAASQVHIGGTIVGGTLKTANGGSILAVGAPALDGSTPGAAITNAGALSVPDFGVSADLTLLGTINNKGSIALQGNADQTSLLIGTGGAALTGGGKVTLTDSLNNIIEGTASANTLLNVDNTISGAGRIGNGQMTLINAAKGVINATGATNSLVIDTGSNVIRNAGTIEATGAHTLFIESPIINTGTLKAAAAGATMSFEHPLANNSQLVAARGKIFINDVISGSGTVTIDFGGTLHFTAGHPGITQNITFANVGTGKARLEFGDGATTDPHRIYNGVISGFTSPNDQIDLEGLAFSGNTSVTKTLQGGNTVIEVAESGKVVDLTLAGNRMASHFVVSDDGAGGTLIVDPPAAAKPDLSHLVHAIASFAPAGLAASPIAAVAGGWGEHAALAASAFRHA